MQNKPLKSILDREMGVIQSNLLHSNLINTSEDVVNYGLNLIIKSYNQSNYELLDSILILNFLKNIVSLLDSLCELSKRGCHLTAPYLARGIIENTFYLFWILKSDSTKRAEYFYVFQLIEELSTASRVGQNPSYYHDLFEKSGLTRTEDFSKISPSANERVSEIKNHLENHFSDLYRKFQAEKPAKWYSFNNGPKSLKELASEIGSDSHYEIFYRDFSKVIHSADLKYNLEISSKGGRIIPIRDSIQLGEMLHKSLSFTFKSYLKIIHKYIPFELENFRKIYIQDWQRNYTQTTV
ncbi:MAG: DUF5677 domain-containing protein [Balneolia bacterium]|nr:DUF5677 domain-containing protein [Balneolia bacterium]